MNVIQTVAVGSAIPEGYFDEDNINFIQQEISKVLAREYVEQIIVSHADIIRIMERILADRRENIPKMNQRVIMTICNDFRDHQIETNRNYRWEDGYTYSQLLIDEWGGISRFDKQSIKLKDQKKYDSKERVGGTTRFYFT